MGNINSGKKLYSVKEDFFKVWSSKMAYILGFTCADGNVHGRSLAWDLSDKYLSNLELLESFNLAMESNYPIEKRGSSYRLRISNRKILEDIKMLGIVPNKKKILIFPDVPRKYLCHFIRGFLDGDGWITTRIRKNGGREICVGFSNGSYNFMKKLVELIVLVLDIKNYNLRKREKIMKNGEMSYCYQLEYYSNSGNVILDFMYGELGIEDLMLSRKYERMVKAKENYLEQEKMKKLGKRYYNFECENRLDVVEFVREKISRGVIPRDIAECMGLSLSSLYRFMDKFEIRKINGIRANGK